MCFLENGAWFVSQAVSWCLVHEWHEGEMDEQQTCLFVVVRSSWTERQSSGLSGSLTFQHLKRVSSIGCLGSALFRNCVRLELLLLWIERSQPRYGYIWGGVSGMFHWMNSQEGLCALSGLKMTQDLPKGAGKRLLRNGISGLYSWTHCLCGLTLKKKKKYMYFRR